MMPMDYRTHRGPAALSSKRFRAIAGIAAAVLLAGCSSAGNPGFGKATDTASAMVQADPTGAEIVTYDGYQVAVARVGDTVASVAQRTGIPAYRLAVYNGLTPDHPMRAGDELVLPPEYEGRARKAAGAESRGSGTGKHDAALTSADQSPADPTRGSPGLTEAGIGQLGTAQDEIALVEKPGADDGPRPNVPAAGESSRPIWVLAADPGPSVTTIKKSE
jgi:LysM repeat protein